MSKHIAELKDAYEQIIGLMEKDQREIDQMIQDEDMQGQRSNSSSAGSGGADQMEQFDHEIAIKDQEEPSNRYSLKND